MRLRADAVLPTYTTEGAAGMDLSAALDAPLVIEPGAHALISTGLAIELPPGHEGQVRPRSGLAARDGVTVLNSPGTIDEDYRGEVRVVLVNHGPRRFVVEPRMRIAQLVVAPVTHVTIDVVEEPLSETARGLSGFGSTGR
jgi:dUTP pyrophosphatase